MARLLKNIYKMPVEIIANINQGTRRYGKKGKERNMMKKKDGGKGKRISEKEIRFPCSIIIHDYNGQKYL